MTNGQAEKVAAVGEVAVVMGIELSKKGWLVALRSPLADRIAPSAPGRRRQGPSGCCPAGAHCRRRGAQDQGHCRFVLQPAT
jgi:hypothetical protein